MYEKYVAPVMTQTWTDEYLYDFILSLEKLNVQAWHKEGVVPDEDMWALDRAFVDWEVYRREFAKSKHDLNSLVKAIMSTLPDATARWIHYQLTTNDVWDTARCNQIFLSLDLILKALEKLVEIAQRRALEFRHTEIMGRTHGQHAEKTTFGHKIAVTLAVPLLGHFTRLENLQQEFRIGKFSGAVGTHANVPASVEEYICEQIGLKPVIGATQVIDQTYYVRYADALNELGGSLQKFFVDIRSLARTEIGEVAEKFEEGSVGSSAMPHKQNPQLSERICGISYSLQGYAVMARAALVLWDERSIDDSSIKRIYLPDSSQAIYYMLNLAAEVLDGLVVFPERMQANIDLTAELSASGRLSNLLVTKGVRREVAYDIVQTMTKLITSELRVGKKELTSLMQLALENPEIQGINNLTQEEIREIFSDDNEKLFQGVDVTFKRLGLI